MAKSSIEWTDWTSNPIGKKGSLANYCVKVSPGCKNCYAEKMSRRLAAISRDTLWNSYTVAVRPDMELRQHVLDEWLRIKKPRKIFVGSMTDIFGDWVPTDWLYQIFHVMEACPHLTFQILTKRAERMRQFVDEWCHTMQKTSLPANIWCGISAENQEWLDKRYDHLLQTKCSVRFLSCEPLLGPLNLAFPGTIPKDWGMGYRPVGSLVHQIIVGGESGPGARPMHPEWVRDIRKQCIESAVPFFFKQWGAYADGSNWPDHKSGPRKSHIVILNNGEHQDYNDRKLNSKYSEGQWNKLQPTVMHKTKKKDHIAIIDGQQYLEFPVMYDAMLDHNRSKFGEQFENLAQKG